MVPVCEELGNTTQVIKLLFEESSVVPIGKKDRFPKRGQKPEEISPTPTEACEQFQKDSRMYTHWYFIDGEDSKNSKG